MLPGATTYRVQLHAGFGFDDAAGIAAYLAELGVTHLYCSPYLQAAAGSTHGYDVVDPRHLNEELGGAGGHARLAGALRDAGLGQVLDIVPNHMAADPANRWWWDVLENGPASRYATFFDIDWQGHDERSAFTVLVPVLGDHVGRVLEAGELSVAREGGSFVLRYHDHRLPLSPRSLDELLGAAARRAGSGELGDLAEAFGSLPHARMTDPAAVVERHERKRELTDALARLCDSEPTVGAAVDAEVAALAADADRLDALLRRQNYRVARWRTASEELDYRRFFNIETLVGVRVEDPAVFDETHAVIVQLVRDGTVDGLRVDHVDGLRDPERYLAQLADATGGAYTVVEKILGEGERLPGSWPVAGTSGYDFLTRVDGLFVDRRHEGALTAHYRELTGETAPWADVVHAAKLQIMREELRAEVDQLTELLARVCDGYRRHRDHTRRELRDALREVVAAVPVYRTYTQPGSEARDEDRRSVAAAVAGARRRRPDLDAELVAFLGELALGVHPGDAEAELAQRLQQLTAPVMAKGVEDTAFYRYHRFVSLNEVGGDPGVFGRPVDAFHEDTARDAAAWPRSMLTLSTHDTKRSADVRARLHVLSEVPEAWAQATWRWTERNARHRTGRWPDANTEYLLYQTIVGAWPIDADRLAAFAAKATREAKVHTSWVDPVPGYDDAVESFARAVLADRGFVGDLEGFLREHRLVERGRRNALVQTALLLTCPGVADLYQGTEVWDLSLVDPDNRRAVDFDRRRALLGALRDAGPGEALERDADGGPKLWLVHRLLAHRRRAPASYDSSSYEPLAVTGGAGDEVVAFHRHDLAVVARCRTAAGGSDPWVDLPGGAWCDACTGRPVGGGRHRVGALLGAWPVAVLARERS